jgi:diketogulonate reductase-like aldo/keto reductase
METVTLNNGLEMPALGLGVFQTPPDETRDAVRSAFGAGYRLIDTAAAYGNERQVGEAIHSFDLDRSEVFLETKIGASHGLVVMAHRGSGIVMPVQQR